MGSTNWIDLAGVHAWWYGRWFVAFEFNQWAYLHLHVFYTLKMRGINWWIMRFLYNWSHLNDMHGELGTCKWFSEIFFSYRSSCLLQEFFFYSLFRASLCNAIEEETWVPLMWKCLFDVGRSDLCFLSRAGKIYKNRHFHRTTKRGRMEYNEVLPFCFRKACTNMPSFSTLSFSIFSFSC